jgi:hypothetical protein
VYLEVLGCLDTSHIKSHDFLFGNAVNGTHLARNQLDYVWSNTKFRKSKPGKLGTHSVRKGASTYANRCRLLRYYVKRRGHWQAQNQVADEYINPMLPYPDIKAGTVLCGHAGPYRCRLKAGMQGLSRTCLLNG